ncbi:MAG: hypothetical protein ACUVT1_06880 [Anaerolineae bacterium]
MGKMMRWCIAGLAGLLLIAGCAAPAAEPATKQLESAPAGTGTPTIEDSVKFQQEAVTDLAKRLQLPEEDITVESASVVELTPDDLRCAGAGELDKTLPAQMMGQEIVLKSGGQRYLYRGYGKRVVFCGELPPAGTTPQPAGGEEPVKSLDEQGQRMLEQARQELAGKLGVSPARIQVVKAEPILWPDTSLGCPQPGMMYAQVITPGYQFILEYEGKQYDYHAGRGHLILCE